MQNLTNKLESSKAAFLQCKTQYQEENKTLEEYRESIKFQNSLEF